MKRPSTTTTNECQGEQCCPNYPTWCYDPGCPADDPCCAGENFGLGGAEPTCCGVVCGNCGYCVDGVCYVPGPATNCSLPGYFSSGSASASPSVACISNAITFSASAIPVPATLEIVTTAADCSQSTNTAPDTITGTGYTWSLSSGGSGQGNSLTTNLPPGVYVWTCTASATGTFCGVVSTNMMATGTVNQTTITFNDSPSRPSTMWPWTWQATLQAVCVAGTNNTSTSFSTSYTSLASITYGLSVDASGNVTSMQKSGDGSPGSVNTIVVSTFTAVNGVAGASSAGINISASYVGCCTGGQMNWVQTLTTDSQPIGAETIPFPDALVKPPTQTPYYFGWPPGGSTWIPWDFMSNHTTTSP